MDRKERIHKVKMLWINQRVIPLLCSVLSTSCVYGQASLSSMSTPDLDRTFHITATLTGQYVWNRHEIWFKVRPNGPWNSVQLSLSPDEGITSVGAGELGNLFVLTSRGLYTYRAPIAWQLAANLPINFDPAQVAVGEKVWVCGGNVDGSAGAGEFPNSVLDATKERILVGAIWELDEDGRTFHKTLFPYSLGRVVEMSKGRTTLARTDYQVYTSHDEGKNWVVVHSPGRKAHDHTPTALAQFGDRKMWIAWSDGSLIKNDGTKWELIPQAVGTNRPVFVKLAFGNVSVGVGQSETKLYQTKDGGVSWTKIAIEDDVADFDLTKDGGLVALTVNGVIELGPLPLGGPMVKSP